MYNKQTDFIKKIKKEIISLQEKISYNQGEINSKSELLKKVLGSNIEFAVQAVSYTESFGSKDLDKWFCDKQNLTLDEAFELLNLAVNDGIKDKVFWEMAIFIWNEKNKVYEDTVIHEKNF